MKNQYFGDINDYRKYGLLRSIKTASDIKPLIAWMLTEDAGSTDGKFTNYLKDPFKWEKYDPVLFNALVKSLKSNEKRNVSLIENSKVLSGYKYFSAHVPDPASERDAWLSSLINKTQESNFIFLDPDNGLEIKSKPYGRKYSSKFLYWREVHLLWSSGKSLLIYQHFIREKRTVFIRRMLSQLSEVATDSIVEAFSTPNVVFFMALQPAHHVFHESIVNSVQESWAGQIHHWDLVAPNKALNQDVTKPRDWP